MVNFFILSKGYWKLPFKIIFLAVDMSEIKYLKKKRKKNSIQIKMMNDRHY